MAAQPVARCGWLSAATVGRALGLPVRRGVYYEEPGQLVAQGYRDATCSYAYRHEPQIPDVSYVNGLTIDYSQGHDSFSDVDTATPGYSAGIRTTVVHGLGACPPDESTCPYTALLSLQKATVRRRRHASSTYLAYTLLGVQDGYKEFAISVSSDYGALPAARAVANLEKLARTIMPLFAAQP